MVKIAFRCIFDGFQRFFCSPRWQQAAPHPQHELAPCPLCCCRACLFPWCGSYDGIFLYSSWIDPNRCMYVKGLADLVFSGLPLAASWGMRLPETEFHLFLMSLSVRLGMYCSEIWAHFVPISCTRSQISWSSSGVHSPLNSCGRKWLRHLSRHCLPFLSWRRVAIAAQLSCAWRTCCCRSLQQLQSAW